MNLPFSVQQFLDLFASYNTAVWPAQIILHLAAIVVIGMSARPFRGSDRIISLVLALFWLWMGLVYHIAFFSSINPAARLFGVLFAIEGIFFALLAIRNTISYRVSSDWRGLTGGIVLAYGVLFYPLLGLALGHHFPAAPSFGVPCPTTIFTFGMLLWATGLPRYLVVIPAAWSLIGFAAALTLGIREDIGLLGAGIVGTSIIVGRPRRRTTPLPADAASPGKIPGQAT